ncbi:UvrB/UvrC motif-containing protein, partial [Porphyromonas loveana]|uniref:UvrB/UvrC motif-containing protein n=1 Tax=Porphyromonas loveana TaxID=1884669 RepID=UPI0035A105F6
DKITESMQLTMDETARRRTKPMAYNEAHGITPEQIVKNSAAIWGDGDISTAPAPAESGAYIEMAGTMAADPLADYLTRPKLEALIATTKKQMLAAAKELDFLQAARLRDEAARLERKLEEMT